MKRKYLYGVLALVAVALTAGAGVYWSGKNRFPIMTGQGDGYARMMSEFERRTSFQAASLHSFTGYTLAEAAIQENDPEKMREALKLGADAAASQPDHPAHWVALGNLYLMAGKFDPMEATEAPVMFTRALEIDPAFIPALLAMGQWHFDRMQYDRSLPHFEKMAEQDSSYLSQNWFLSLLTSNYILAGKADIGAEKLERITGTNKKRQQAIVLLKKESGKTDLVDKKFQ